MSADRFQLVTIAVACGCTATVKRWEREQYYRDGDRFGCQGHGLSTVTGEVTP